MSLSAVGHGRLASRLCGSRFLAFEGVALRIFLGAGFPCWVVVIVLRRWYGEAGLVKELLVVVYCGLLRRS
jgi:hypothetical protein